MKSDSKVFNSYLKSKIKELGFSERKDYQGLKLNEGIEIGFYFRSYPNDNQI